MIITMKGVTKVYNLGEKREVHALSGVSFSIEKEEFVAVVGESGSGKSTLVNIIGCLDKPTSGMYKLEDIEVENMNEDKLAEVRNKKIGFVFQTFNLIPRMNVLKNVELPMLYAKISPKERYNRAMEVIAMVGLSHRISHPPSELSGGEQQRVAIARALVNQPSLLLADEPTGNLDSHTSEEIINIFQRLHEKGVTIILVTHNEKMTQYAQKVIHLHDGRILEDE